MSEMARTTQKAAIDGKIEKAQEKVVRSKDRYDAAANELKLLMDKKEALMKGELMDAFAKSDKSYDEILEFLQGCA